MECYLYGASLREQKEVGCVVDGAQMPGEIRDFGGIGDVGEELASEIEGRAAAHGGSSVGVAWLGDVYGCGMRTVLWCVFEVGVQRVRCTITYFLL